MPNFGKVIACFKQMDFKPKLSSFQDRLVIQKTVFLLEKMGVKTGFAFGLYVHGPYSPELADYAFAHQEELNAQETREKLGRKERGETVLVKELISKPKLLEIAATYLCLRQDCKLSEDDAVSKLKELKPYFSESDFVVGISKAKELTFRPTKEELREIRKETALWDRLSDEAWAKIE